MTDEQTAEVARLIDLLENPEEARELVRRLEGAASEARRAADRLEEAARLASRAADSMHSAAAVADRASRR